MKVSELISLLSAHAGNDEICLALPIRIGGAPAYTRGKLLTVAFLPLSFHGTKQQLFLLGELDNGGQSPSNPTGE